MEFDAEGRVSKFDVNDVIEIEGNKYIVGKSSAFNLNCFLELMNRPSCQGKEYIDKTGVSLRRLGSPSFGGEYDNFNYDQVLSSPSLIQNKTE